MCIAIPYRVIDVDGKGCAHIEVNGTVQSVSTLLIPRIEAGDYVLVYAGSAMSVLQEQEALEVLNLYQSIFDAVKQDTGLAGCFEKFGNYNKRE